MERERRRYRQTDSGRKAWESRHSGLPPAYRRILGLIQGTACCDEVFAGMHDCSSREVQGWLDELETLCFIEALPFASPGAASEFPQAA
jgi:hypothetical protein